VSVRQANAAPKAPQHRPDRPHAAATEPDDEETFLREYRRATYPRPSLAVDVVVLTIVDATLAVLLIRRRDHPYRGCSSLPGGFVRVGDAYDDRGEDLEEAAARVLAAKTGLPKGAVYLQQLATFGRADRDPRMRIVSVAYHALVRPDLVPLVRIGPGATAADWVPVSRLAGLSLAFDHRDIVAAALERIRADLSRAGIAFELVPPTFSIQELRNVHEVILGQRCDPGNFRRRFRRLLEDGVIERAPGKRLTASKPAQVYRFVRRARATQS
jgi:8-oxo-dGTP diphosphatase